MVLTNEYFTLDAYRQYLATARNQYDICFYDECFDRSEFLLWRHDIDVSVHRAARLARLEYEEGVKATYFIWLHSYTYHFWEKEIADLIFHILNMEHSIGLHFDCAYYPEIDSKNIGEIISEEARILEKVFQTRIKVFSFHDTSEEILQNNKAERIGGLINTYSEYFFRKCKYISDSNGMWRDESPLDVLDSKKYPRLQILTHPVWWTEKPFPPVERILQCIDGRYQKNRSTYIQAREGILKQLGLTDSDK